MEIELETKSGKWTVNLMRKEDPLLWIEQMFPKKDIKHIKYDEEVIPEYNRIESSMHDGTLIFTHELIFKVLHPIVFKNSYSIKKPPPGGIDGIINNIRYTIGKLHICDVPGKWSFGPVKHAIKEVVFMPIKTSFENKSIN
jgi:hypothetical protein